MIGGGEGGLDYAFIADAVRCTALVLEGKYRVDGIDGCMKNVLRKHWGAITEEYKL